MTGHVQQGRVFRSPLAATGVLHISDWVRHDLPDLLWPIAVMSEGGTDQGARFMQWQDAVYGDLAGLAEARVIGEGLDGRLTGLDRLAAAIPEGKDILRARALECGLLSEPVMRLLASYPDRPAPWFTGRAFAPPDQAVVNTLARAIYEVATDGHREAMVKYISVRGDQLAGTLSHDATMAELLRSYPYDDATRGRADSVIRASWGSGQAALLCTDASRFDSAHAWAKVFWEVNLMTTRCRREAGENRDVRVDASGPEIPPGSEAQQVGEESVMTDVGDVAAPTPMPAEGAHLQRLALDVFTSYLEALENSLSRLYEKEVQEVHSGLVSRAAREVITALGIPDLWSMEHGSHVIRTLVEVRIYLQWMSLQDPSIYRAFQEYGAGKAKLYARMLDELPEEARNADFVEGIKEFEHLSHNEGPLDHRVVDTRDTFADGKSIRAMAEEAGLIDLYRHGYSVASGFAHSEWWSIESNAMERCRNLLHGGHLIPSLALNAGGNVPLAHSWIDQLYALVRFSLRALRADVEVVDEAFAWLTSEDSDEDGRHHDDAERLRDV